MKRNWIFARGDKNQNQQVARTIPTESLPGSAADLDRIGADARRQHRDMQRAGRGTTDPDDYGPDDATMDDLSSLDYAATMAAQVVRDEGRRRRGGSR